MTRPLIGRLVRVADRRVNAYQRGQGGPTVVIEAGGGNIAFDWSHIVDALAEHTCCVAYDRAGLGWSDPSDRSRTPTSIARELKALLDVLDVPRPYVLVGHSLGGIFIRRFAELFPDQVAGIVMVEPSHPRQWRRLPAARVVLREAMRRPTRNAKAEWRSQVRRQRPSIPPALLDERARVQFRERSVDVAAEEFRAAFSPRSRVGSRPLPTVPLLILTRGRPQPRPGLSVSDSAAFERVWHQLHLELTHLVPHGSLLVVKRSGHRVQWDEPERIVSAVLRVVRRARAAARSVR